MRLPVKDRTTTPWISEREIPAVKIVLSAWRKLRKDEEQMRRLRDSIGDAPALAPMIGNAAYLAAWNLELAAQMENMVYKENDDGKDGKDRKVGKAGKDGKVGA